MELLVNGAHGIYVPQVFAQWYGELLAPDQLEVLLAGPEHKHYWDVWDEVQLDGRLLWQDSDLWAVEPEE